MGPLRTFLRPAVVTAAAVLVLAVVGCTPEPPASPGASPDVTAADAGATADAEDAPSVLMLEGSAHDNLPFFSAVVDRVAASADGVAGRAYVDALVAAGFEKGAMQVTADRTSVDDPVDSLQFSVLWAGECLVGQVGPSTPAPTAMVLPELPSGGCLLGSTRPIDW
ncbi:hypothetical protein [Microbacterium sp. cf332]|uniref:DUF6993 domain-containing protein n=1 Tax=Microbacterium sp. cf332 TaxID=1761804 RepID=UPI00088A7A68|nr:hypothetical protein [Microbacterium sp. cf332]SDQ10097.1 hypothetical protein SAMN04487847_0346 [Microbacterium sp. cf332]